MAPKKKNFVEFIQKSPLAGSDIDLEREQTLTRPAPIDLSTEHDKYLAGDYQVWESKLKKVQETLGPRAKELGIVSEEGKECLDSNIGEWTKRLDAMDAADSDAAMEVLQRIRQGKEKTHTIEDVERKLGLANKEMLKQQLESKRKKRKWGAIKRK